MKENKKCTFFLCITSKQMNTNVNFHCVLCSFLHKMVRSEQTWFNLHSVNRCPTRDVHNTEKESLRKCVEHHLCHPSSHLLSQRKDSDSEITEFCLRTEEANNTSGDGDSSEDSFPSLSFSRRLGPQSPHCVLRGRHNGPLVRLIVSRMHVKTRRLKPFFVAF